LGLLEANSLIIGDSHIPFEHPHYLDFVVQIQKRVKCKNVFHIGDLVDNHSISYHEKDPDGKSPKEEYKDAKKKLLLWKKAFPEMRICRGNHDCLVDRKGRTAGLPSEVFKQYREIWEFPEGWVDDWDFDFHGVYLTHGTGYSGKNAHVQAAYDARKSAVIGHIHSVGAVQYIDTGTRPIFGMQVGCGIDRRKYAFAYGKDFRYKPILGCGVMTDYGKYAQFMPMS